MEIKTCSVSTAELAYQIFGAGSIDLVVEMGLGLSWQNGSPWPDG